MNHENLLLKFNVENRFFLAFTQIQLASKFILKAENQKCWPFFAIQEFFPNFLLYLEKWMDGRWYEIPHDHIYGQVNILRPPYLFRVWGC